MGTHRKAIVYRGQYFPDKMVKCCRILLNALERGESLESYSMVIISINFPTLKKCAFTCTNLCRAGQELPCLDNLRISEAL